MKSLRGRLILGIIASLFLFLGLNSALVYYLLRRDLYRDVQRSTEAVVRATAETLDLEIGRRIHQGTPLTEKRPLLPEDRSGEFLLQAWLEDGSVIGESVALRGRALPRLKAPEGKVTTRRITLPDGSEHVAAGTRIRVRLRPGGPPPPPPRPRPPRGAPRTPPIIEVVAARDLGPTDAMVRRILGFLAGAWITAALGASFIVAVVVRRTLRPVDRLRDQIAGLDAASLDRSLAVRGLPAELRPVVDQLRGLLERVRSAFEREQSFAGYAAHELRTPIAELRSTLEVCLNRPRQSAEYQETVRECLGITEEMQRRVQSLLDVARAQTRQRSPERSRFGLRDCLQEFYEPHREVAGTRDLRLDLRIPPELEVVTDRPLLEHVLGNMSQNAVRHAREGSTIEVTAVEEAGHLELTMRNEIAPGPRKDHRSGLGLSLAERVLDELGGSLTVTPGDSSFQVRIRLPGPGD